MPLYVDLVRNAKGRRMTRTAREIAFRLELKAGKTRKAFYSQGDLCDITGYGPSSVNRALRSLEAGGFIVARTPSSITLRPNPDPKDVPYIWGYPGWVEHQRYEDWQKHILAFIFGQRHGRAGEAYRMQIDRIIRLCYVPGMTEVERRASVKGFIAEMRGDGLCRRRSRAAGPVAAVYEFPEELLASPPFTFERGGIVGTSDLYAVATASSLPCFSGPLGLCLRQAKPILFVPMLGRLGFFEVAMTGKAP